MRKSSWVLAAVCTLVTAALQARDCKPLPSGVIEPIASGQTYQLDLSRTLPGAREVRIEESLDDDFRKPTTYTYRVGFSPSLPSFRHWSMTDTRVWYRVSAFNDADPSFVPCTWTTDKLLLADPELAEFRIAVIPVAGTVSGVSGSRFRTSVDLFNDLPEPIHGDLVFHPANRSGASSDPRLHFALEPFERRSFDDIAAAFGVSGLGSIDIVLDADSEQWLPVVQTRIFNERSDGATFGMAVPVVLVREFGGSMNVIAVPNPVKARVNVGVRTWSFGGSLTIDLIRGRTAVVSRKVVDLGPTYFAQFSAQDLVGQPLLEGDVLRVNAVGAVSYATITDNASGDPLMLIPFADQSGSYVKYFFQ